MSLKERRKGRTGTQGESDIRGRHQNDVSVNQQKPRTAAARGLEQSLLGGSLEGTSPSNTLILAH